MSESYFTKLANEILDGAEKIADRFEEGLNIIMGAQSTDSTGSGTPPESPPADHEFEGWDGMEDGEVMDESSPLAGIAQGVMEDIMSAQKGPETLREHLDAFRHAITWSEPFILGLLAFQMTMFALTLYVSRRDVGTTPRIVLLVTMGVLVRSAEYINQWAAHEWSSFCTQNYFDARGIFVAIFLCAPLLLDAFIMLVLFLREAAQLLVQVKKAELRKKRQDAKATTATQRRSKKDQ